MNQSALSVCIKHTILYVQRKTLFLVYSGSVGKHIIFTAVVLLLRVESKLAATIRLFHQMFCGNNRCLYFAAMPCYIYTLFNQKKTTWVGLGQILYATNAGFRLEVFTGTLESVELSPELGPWSVESYQVYFHCHRLGPEQSCHGTKKCQGHLLVWWKP